MADMTEAELLRRTERKDKPFAVFVYTPFCGTCKVAARMLDIIAAAHPELPLDRININFIPGLAERWTIESVPCLLLLEGDRPTARLYAFRSIQHVYRFLRPLLDNESKGEDIDD
jgi:thioredoxin-like negative regulator of GroEL